jgi:hypothetical protein
VVKVHVPCTHPFPAHRTWLVSDLIRPIAAQSGKCWGSTRLGGHRGPTSHAGITSHKKSGGTGHSKTAGCTLNITQTNLGPRIAMPDMRRQEADGLLGLCWEENMSCSSVQFESRHRTCRASVRCLVRITTMEQQRNVNNPPMSISTASCIGASQPIPRPTSTASHLMEPCGTAGPPRSAYEVLVIHGGSRGTMGRPGKQAV